MYVVVPDANITFDASEKTITLAAPYSELGIGQVISIINLTTNEVLYDSVYQRVDMISISGAVITHTHVNTRHADTDDLQVIVNIPEQKTAFTKETLTVADTAVGFTSGTYLTATGAVITAEDAPMRVFWDGSTPTSSVGQLIAAGDIIILKSASDIANFKAIRTTAVSGKLTSVFSR